MPLAVVLKDSLWEMKHPQHSSSNQKQTQLIREDRKFHQTGSTAGVGPTGEDKEEESLAALPGFNDLAPQADLPRVFQQLQA